MRLTLKALILSPLLLVAGPVAADEVFLLNGDRLTGKFVSATGGKLILKTDAAGDITIDLAKVKTFSTEAPVQLQLGGKTVVESRVAAGVEGALRGLPDRVSLRLDPPTWAGRAPTPATFWARGGRSEPSRCQRARYLAWLDLAQCRAGTCASRGPN